MELEISKRLFLIIIVITSCLPTIIDHMTCYIHALYYVQTTDVKRVLGC